MKTKIKVTLIDREIYPYYKIEGCKWINRARIPDKMEKGYVFSVYRREYEVDKNGNITKWIHDQKHGCEYDGKSLVSSLKKADKEIEEYYAQYKNIYGDMKPLTGLEPCV